MILVKYEKYVNDYNRKEMSISFTSLQEVADWIFNQMQQDYTKDWYCMFLNTDFTTGELRTPIGGPTAIQFRPVLYGPDYFIREITKDDKIIFSDGTYTCKKRHWSKEVQEWLKECQVRRTQPHFEFAE